MSLRKPHPSIEAVRAEARPGRCIYCDGKLPLYHRLVCRKEECRRLHNRNYQRDYKRQLRGSTRELPRKGDAR